LEAEAVDGILNELLVNIFKDILSAEEYAVRESTQGNLTITEIHTLEAIGMFESAKMSDVAQALKVTVSTFTTAVNKLAVKGYVVRNKADADRRIAKNQLNRKGRRGS
jgi:DNA-binding MarR family transcriptional regulator